MSRGSIASALAEEIQSNPKSALILVESLVKILEPWEELSASVQDLEDLTVPPGQNVKDFMKKATQGFVSGYRLSTIFGKEVALITKDQPKWKVIINGKYQTDSPLIKHGQKAEVAVKQFVEEKLLKLGYVFLS